MFRFAPRLLAVASVALVAPAATAQTFTWTGAGGNLFQSPQSWSPTGIPAASATALLNFTGPGTYYMLSPTTWSVGGFTLGQGNLEFDPVASTFTVLNSGEFVVGNTGGQTANLTIDRGTFAFNGGRLGTVAGGSGNLTIGGTASATVTSSDAVYVGLNGAGSITILNGSSLAIGNSSVVGLSTGSSGSLAVTSGSLTAGAGLVVGNTGAGVLTVGGVNTTGTATLGDGLVVGYNPGSTGTLTVNPTGTLTTQGTVTLGLSAPSGIASAASGTVSVGGTWNHTNAGTANVVTAGGGRFSLTVLAGGVMNVGGQPGSGISITASNIGFAASLSVNGGAVSVTGAGNGISVGSYSTLEVAGGVIDLTSAGSGLTVGGNGAVSLDRGMINTRSLGISSGQAVMGLGSSSSLTVSNGTVSAAGYPLTLVGGGSAQFNLASGTSATAQALVTLAGSITTPTFTVNVSGGSSLVTQSSNIAHSVIAITGAGSSWTSAGLNRIGYDSYPNDIASSGTLVVSGGGRVALGDTIVGSYFQSHITGSGPTQPSTGVVRILGAGSSLAAGSISVGEGLGTSTTDPGSNGTLVVDQGGAVTGDLLLVAAYGSNPVGAVTVGGSAGATSALTVQSGVYIATAHWGLDYNAGGTGTLTLQTGGVVTTPLIKLGAGGTLNLAGGTLNVAQDVTVGGGTVNHTSGTLNYTDNATITRSVVVNGGTLSVTGGKTATLNATTMSGGTLAGPGTFATAGGPGSAFTAVTTAPSATLTLGGADTLTNSTLGGATTVLASGFTPFFNRTTNTASGRLTVNSTAQLGVADFVNSGLLTIADGTGTSNRSRVTNTGSSDLYFGGGSRTFVGTPGGAAAGNLATLNLGGHNLSVAGGLLVNNGVVSNGTVVADYGALVKGAGSYTTLPVTQNGGAYQAGNSPGRATVGSADLNGGGTLIFQINNATGTAGPTPDTNNQVSGWGLVVSHAYQNDPDFGTTTGNLSVSATPTNKYNLKLQTLQNPTTVGQNNYGPMANFDPAQSYRWAILTYEGGYTGPADPNTVVTIDGSQFANAANGTFALSLDATAQVLSLAYTPVPEPGAGIGVAAAGLGWAAARRARRRGP